MKSAAVAIAGRRHVCRTRLRADQHQHRHRAPAPQYEVVLMIAPGVLGAGILGLERRAFTVRGRSIVQRDGYVWAPDR
jgi:hypothetical protein